MAKIHKKGDTIKGYVIVSDGPLNRGEFAISYESKRSDGQKLFFKQYKNPTSKVPGFCNFVNAQREFQSRLNRIEFSENIYELFEIDTGYGQIHYQAKEFMKGKDLRGYFEEHSSVSLIERKLISTVFVYALHKIHEAGIVHTDLKPEQIFLEEVPTIELKYKIKICDFDFSRIPGNYEPLYKVTTPLYSSPEHINGKKIDYCSDRFTAGIVLYEILTGKYPYDIEDFDQYDKAVFDYKVKKPCDIVTEIPESVSEAVWSLLNPNCAGRCELKELHNALLDWKDKQSFRIRLESPQCPIRLSFHQTTIFTRSSIRKLMPEYKYVDHKQFRLEKTELGWDIEGCSPVVNNTYLNGDNITGKKINLKDGDIVFIGNVSSQNGLKFNVVFEPI